MMHLWENVTYYKNIRSLHTLNYKYFATETLMCLITGTYSIPRLWFYKTHISQVITLKSKKRKIFEFRNNLGYKVLDKG